MNKQFSSDEINLLCLTKLNTKINRDHLDQSQYFTEKGIKQIFGDDIHQQQPQKVRFINNKKNIKRRVTFTSNVECFD